MKRYQFFIISEGYSFNFLSALYVYHSYTWYILKQNQISELTHKELATLFEHSIYPGIGFVIYASDFDYLPASQGSEQPEESYFRLPNIKLRINALMMNTKEEMKEVLLPDWSFKYSFELPNPPRCVERDRNRNLYGAFFLFSSGVSIITSILNDKGALKSSIINFISILFFILALGCLFPRIKYAVCIRRYKHNLRKYNLKINRIILNAEYERRLCFRQYCKTYQSCLNRVFARQILNSLNAGTKADIPKRRLACSDDLIVSDINLKGEFTLSKELKLSVPLTSAYEIYIKFTDYLNMNSGNLLEVLKEAVPKGLSVPIGYDQKRKEISLDLLDGHDGPHMLICGTTGSGKSEFILTYMMNLFTLYSPEVLNVCIIDFKGGATGNKLKTLPHVIGVSDNLGETELKRCIYAIKNEVKRREALQSEINHKIPELFIIIDEFAELKSGYPDYMNEFIKIARVGRSLGIHLILITQQVTGVVDRDILLNTNVKIAFHLMSEGEALEVTKCKLPYEDSKAGSFTMFSDRTQEIVHGMSYYINDTIERTGTICNSQGLRIYERSSSKGGLTYYDYLFAEIQSYTYVKPKELWLSYETILSNTEFYTTEYIERNMLEYHDALSIKGLNLLLMDDKQETANSLLQLFLTFNREEIIWLTEDDDCIKNYNALSLSDSLYLMQVYEYLSNTNDDITLYISDLHSIFEGDYHIADLYERLLLNHKKNVTVICRISSKTNLSYRNLKLFDKTFEYDKNEGIMLEEGNRIYYKCVSPDCSVLNITKRFVTNETSKELLKNYKGSGMLCLGISYAGNNLLEISDSSTIVIINTYTALNKFTNYVRAQKEGINIVTVHDDITLDLEELRITRPNAVFIYYGPEFEESSLSLEYRIVGDFEFKLHAKEVAYLINNGQALIFRPFGKESL